MRSDRLRSAAFIACFLLSGAAGLVYEIAWVRMASLAFGSTTVALSTVLAVFFGGIALGSAVFGHVSQRTTRPLRLYAVLELALAAVGLATPWLFDLADGVFGRVYRAAGGGGVGVDVVRAGLLAAILLPPTVVMGATLPLFCRQMVVHERRIAGSVGFLYGVNTLGAAAGCAAAGFALLPTIGVRGSIILAAVLNLFAGAVVGVLGWRTAVPAATAPTADDTPVPRGRVLVVAGLFLLTGLVALGAEVIWTRFLALLVPNTVHTYTITLTVVLVGIVLGSWMTARLFDRAVPRAFVFGALQAAVGLVLLTTLLLPAPIWQGLRGGAGMYALLLLPTAVLSGASFPLAVRMVLRHPSRAGIGVGAMTAVNTAGGIAGALLAGFVGLPLLGLEASVRGLSAVAIGGAVVAWLALGDGGRRGLRLGAAIAVVAAWLAIPLLLDTRLPADHLADRAALLAHREGTTSNLAIVRRGAVRTLEIDRWWQGEDRRNHQIMAAHVPMVVHEDPRSVLVVGIGTGQTADRFLMHGARRLDLVDIEPALLEFVPEHFDAAWPNDPRVTCIAEDGRNHIAHSGAVYDVISLEIGQLFRPGVATFYTRDFNELAAERLAPGGLLVQFVPLPFLTVEEFRRIVRSFIDVLPESMLWYNTAELLLLGRRGAPIAIDPRRHDRALGIPAVAEDLGYAHWGGAAHALDRVETFLGGFLCGPAALAAIARDVEPYRDDRPVLEYAPAHRRAMQRREIDIVDVLRPHLASIEPHLAAPLSSDALAAVRRVQRDNVNAILSQANLRVVELAEPPLPPARVVELLSEALRRNPDDFACHRQMADALIRGGNLESAYAHLATALALRPGDALANRGIAYLYLRAGRFEEAIPHLRTALAADPDDADAHNYLGAALGQLGDHAGAVRHFEAALRLRPGDGDIAANLDRARRAVVR